MESLKKKSIQKRMQGNKEQTETKRIFLKKENLITLNVHVLNTPITKAETAKLDFKKQNHCLPKNIH